MPRNQDELMTHLLGMMIMGASDYIYAQEKQGQAEVVRRKLFPLEIHGATREELEAIGFVFGEPVDELFQECTLPEGWTIRPTDHSMWSHIVDENGEVRGSIFYKAAFYDRSAFASVKIDRPEQEEE